jgi:tagaturonate reductase
MHKEHTTKRINEVYKNIQRPERVLQFGEGNFLRAFVDWMLDILNEKTDFNGQAVLVQPIDRGMADLINGQDGLYTTILRGIQGGKVVEEPRVIHSVSRCINPYADYASYIACAENPELRFIVSNTTEAGIAYGAADKPTDTPQASYPGKVAAFLYHRYQHFKGDPSRGLVVICCELIEHNGDKLREIVYRLAGEWKLESGFTAWLDSSCDFLSTLVDRIVTGYPRDEAEASCRKLGYEDALLDTAEIFHLWVIEAKKRFYDKELPFEEAGLHVVWTKDMSPYRTRKVRVLNGGHTMTVLAAYLYGKDTVEECIEDPKINAYLRRGIYDEVIPAIPNGNVKELSDFADDVMERFANPYIKHLLLSISLNSVSKFKARVLPSLLEYNERFGKLPAVMSFSLAALIAFYRGTKIVDKSLQGLRNGLPYAINDDLPILEAFAALWADYDGSREKSAQIVHAVLGKAEWWGEDLNMVKDLAGTCARHLFTIENGGIAAALESL